MHKERRRHPRYIAPASLVAKGKFNEIGELQLQIRNISSDGMSFVTEKNIFEEVFFNLSLELKGEEPGHLLIDTPSKIVWYTFDEESSQYMAGVQFLGITETERRSLEKFLSSQPPDPN